MVRAPWWCACGRRARRAAWERHAAEGRLVPGGIARSLRCLRAAAGPRLRPVDIRALRWKLGAALRAAQHQAGLRARDVAELAGCGRSEVSGCEFATGAPDLMVLLACARVLGLRAVLLDRRGVPVVTSAAGDGPEQALVRLGEAVRTEAVRRGISAATAARRLGVDWSPVEEWLSLGRADDALLLWVPWLVGWRLVLRPAPDPAAVVPPGMVPVCVGPPRPPGR